MRKFTPQDIRKWNDKYEWERNKIINGELQHYKECNFNNSPITDSGGVTVLRLSAISELVKGKFTDNDGNKWNKQKFSSAMFQSFGKETVKAGDAVTIRCKLPSQDGCFPAFWLLRTDPVWQKTEIDIFEGIKGVRDGSYHTAHHSHTAEGGTYQKHGEKVTTGKDLVNEFHDYGLKLHQTYMEFLFDGAVVAKVDLHEHEQGLEYYMLLNLAIAPSGSWAGAAEGVQLTWKEANLDVESIIVTNDDSPQVVTPESTAVVAAVAGTTMVTDGVVSQGTVIDSPADSPADTTSIDLNNYEPSDEVKAIVENLYENSTTAAQFFYDIARTFGGKV